jgi:hypothetical protein
MNRFHNESSTSARRWLGVAALALGFATAGAGTALAQPHQPPVSISSCSSGPYTISSSSTFYRVTADLTAANNKDCIDIKASNVVLDLHGHKITGLGDVLGGGTSGIKIFSGNTFDVIEGADNFILNFDVGIQIAGNYAVVEDVNAVNNITSGIWFNSVSYSQVTNTDAFASSTFSPDNDQLYGVRITGSYRAGLGDGVFQANATYGIWIQQSNATLVWNVFSENNNSASIYLGCSSVGFFKTGTSCGPGKTYGGNEIYDSFFDNNDPLGIGGGPTDFGVAVDKTEIGDSIFQIDAHDNNAVNGNIYAVGDANCQNNLYFLNNTGSPASVFPACVQTN